MKRFQPYFPLIFTALVVLVMLVHGPIAQLLHYHEFADTRPLLGISNAGDVMSNIGFFLVGLWGAWCLWPHRAGAKLRMGWPGYRLFVISLMLTAAGSAYYHLAPGDGRLIWDRLPIALACAGLLMAVRAETQNRPTNIFTVIFFMLAAGFSVAWWYVNGDLRPYLLLQGLPLVLVPLWQWIYRAPLADRRAFSLALSLYVVAKVAELSDHQILSVLGIVSGHTLKHVLASVAAGLIIRRLIVRCRAAVNATGEDQRDNTIPIR